MKKFLCFIFIFIFIITAAGCTAGQGDFTETEVETEEGLDGGMPTVGAPSINFPLAYGKCKLSVEGLAELDGESVYCPFVLEKADSDVEYNAKRAASGFVGEVLHICVTTSPGYTFKKAKVTFKITGVKKSDKLYVISKAGGSWDLVDATVISDEHVLVTLSGNGPLLFFKRKVS